MNTHPPEPSGPDLKARVREAQGRILDQLAQIEMRIGQIYSEYARRFPGQRNVWARLARDEQMHAETLRGLAADLDRGHVFWNLGEFRLEALASEIEFMDRAMEAARTPGLAEEDALLAAMTLEQYLLENRFYRVVRSDSPRFQAALKILNGGTEQHCELLREQLGLPQPPAAGPVRTPERQPAQPPENPDFHAPREARLFRRQDRSAR